MHTLHRCEGMRRSGVIWSFGLGPVSHVNVKNLNVNNFHKEHWHCTSCSLVYGYFILLGIQKTTKEKQPFTLSTTHFSESLSPVPSSSPGSLAQISHWPLTPER
jgi:hypothetical protein